MCSFQKHMLFSKLWVWLVVYTKTTFSSVFLFLFQKLVKDLFDFRFFFLIFFLIDRF